jgi:antitoxin ParD1/3/4
VSQTLSIALPDDIAEMVRVKVASGDYANASEVVEDGLRTLLERDGDIEAWLRQEVVPTLEKMHQDPSRLIPIEDVERELEAYMLRHSGAET